tara:strand:+ start:123 stop:509 length:387 start_codon:yes stop_codon:yes gene_type:complete
MNDSTKVMIGTMYQDIKGAVASIAEGLSIGAEHVYTVLVRQQVVTSIVMSIVLIIGSMGFVLILNALAKSAKEDARYWHKEMSVIHVILLLCTFIVMFVGLINLDTIITGFVNPEYGAMHEIIDMIKK